MGKLLIICPAYNEAKKLPKLINETGIINVGGRKMSAYNFAKKWNKKTIRSKNKDIKIPSNQTMNLKKLRKILN